MTTSAFTMAPTQTTDAEFRAWVAAVIAALGAVGMVQTADTGQINTTTVLKPSVVSTSMGYVVFRFADTMQATAPLFLKVEFGSAGSVLNPGMWLTVGKSSDGAGAIGGILFARSFLAGGGTIARADTSSQNSYASAGDGWLALIPCAGWNPTEGTFPGYFVIERTTDATGTPTADGVSVATYIGGGNTAALAETNSALLPAFVAINYTTAAQNAGIIPVVVPQMVNGAPLAGSTALASGGIGPVFPWVALAPALAPWQCVSALSYPGGDAPAGEFTATLAGAPKTFLALPLNNNLHAFGIAISPSTLSNGLISRYIGLAIRWE